MEVYRTVGAMASVVLLWAGVVSTSGANDSLTYRCQTDGESYTQKVSASPSLQVRLRSNGRMQELAPGTDNNPQALAAFQATGISADCVALSLNESKRLWPDGAQVTRVYFPFDQAELTDAARATLTEVAEKMRASNQTFVVEGHTDSLGKEPYNQRLGQRRAESVTAFLAEQSVLPKQMQVRSQGEAMPIKANRKPSERALNRRVEIIVRINS